MGQINFKLSLSITAADYGKSWGNANQINTAGKTITDQTLPIFSMTFRQLSLFFNEGYDVSGQRI